MNVFKFTGLQRKALHTQLVYTVSPQGPGGFLTQYRQSDRVAKIPSALINTCCINKGAVLKAREGKSSTMLWLQSNYS